MHDGTEGELYDLDDDPLQRVNRFDDPRLAAVRASLLERLATHDAPRGRRVGAARAPRRAGLTTTGRSARSRHA